MIKRMWFVGMLLAVSAVGLVGQEAAERVRAALPPTQADRIVMLISAAREDGLPSVALEQIALQGIVKRADPDMILEAVAREDSLLRTARSILLDAGRTAIQGGEIRAAANALRRGVPESAVGAVASQAPTDRPVAIPLFVLAGLTDRGLASDDALGMIVRHMHESASDAMLERLPREAALLFAEGHDARAVALILAQFNEGITAADVPRNPGTVRP